MSTKTREIKIKVENDYKGKSNWLTSNLLDCVIFWNNAGGKALQVAREEDPDAHTREFDDELLEKMLIDCKTYCNCDIVKGKSFRKIHGEAECGRTRSHVWVHLNGKRIFMFYTNVPV